MEDISRCRVYYHDNSANLDIFRRRYNCGRAANGRLAFSPREAAADKFDVPRWYLLFRQRATPLWLARRRPMICASPFPLAGSQERLASCSYRSVRGTRVWFSAWWHCRRLNWWAALPGYSEMFCVKTSATGRMSSGRLQKSSPRERSDIIYRRQFVFQRFETDGISAWWHFCFEDAAGHFRRKDGGEPP